MDILINELSLDSQFSNESDFLDTFLETIKIINIIDKLSFSLLKKYDLYSCKVTNNLDLGSILKIKGNDKITKFKSFLSKLMNDPPYWELEQKHLITDIYECNQTTLTSGYSIAESCERDKIVLSFKNSNFSNDIINLTKNTEPHEIYNSIDYIKFLDFLYIKGKISEIDYCLNRFTINLNFSNLDNEEKGFRKLENEEKNAFITTFIMFSNMTWKEISESDGLDYKPYSPSSKSDYIFKNTQWNNKTIYKFRCSQKYRCFGYREKDTFFVLFLEKDHKISDKG